MLTKIKALLALIAGVALIGWRIFVSGKKSAKAEIKAQAEETAREYEQAGYEAARDGITREQEVNEKPIDTFRRDHFS